MSNPEIAKNIKTGKFNTNYHDLGSGEPIMFIHGSGPGVSAYANWRGSMPVLAEKFRVIAPDMVGFGYTDRPEGIVYNNKNPSGDNLGQHGGRQATVSCT